MELMLKFIREMKGITQPQMAELLDMKLATYRTWEQGSVKITLENAYRCALVLGCDVNEICGWYIDHDRNIGEALSSAESSIVGFYRESTPEQKDMIMMSARNSALVSKSAAERDPLRRADEASA